MNVPPAGDITGAIGGTGAPVTAFEVWAFAKVDKPTNTAAKVFRRHEKRKADPRAGSGEGTSFLDIRCNPLGNLRFGI